MTDDWEIGSSPIVQQFVRYSVEGGEKKMSVWHITVTRYWPATDGSMFLSPIYHFFFFLPPN
jgi:hypothetical protein